MSKGKKTLIALAVLLAVALVSGLTTMAVTNYGSQSDPLVTLSYLNETLTPAIKSQVEAAINAKAAELEQAFASANPGTAAQQQSGFSVLTLSNGQTVVCEVGVEIMPRIGSVVSAGADNPRLVDETDGSTVAAAGTKLATNHMYMVTIKGNGIKATANNTKVLIRGSYTVS